MENKRKIENPQKTKRKIKGFEKIKRKEHTHDIETEKDIQKGEEVNFVYSFFFFFTFTSTSTTSFSLYFSANTLFHYIQQFPAF